MTNAKHPQPTVEAIKAAVAKVGATRLAADAGCSERTIYRIIAMNRWPSQVRVSQGLRKALGVKESAGA